MGSLGVLELVYPVGLDVEVTLIPVTDGAYLTTAHSAVGGDEIIWREAGQIHHVMYFKLYTGVASVVKARATVWSDSYLSPSAAKRKVDVAFLKNPKKALKKLKKRR